MSHQKELLIMQLVNLVDKLALYSRPIDQWDGTNFSENIENYPVPAEVPSSPSIILSKGFHPVSVVPSVLLNKIFSVMAGVGANPGLEDYLTGDWVE